ncbi:hypothetical protein CsSME_00012255 [Camellia sinensis var. sinensis]
MVDNRETYSPDLGKLDWSAIGIVPYSHEVFGLVDYLLSPLPPSISATLHRSQSLLVHHYCLSYCHHHSFPPSAKGRCLWGREIEEG